MKQKYWLTGIIGAALVGAAFYGCGSEEADSPATTGSTDATLTAAAETYAQIVLASYEDSLITAQTLDGAIGALTSNADEATLSSAKNAWLAAREPYLQTEVYRFYDGPIDNPDNGPEGLLNAWPMDEIYIDYVTDEPNAGIVNDPSQTIDAATLESLNEEGGEANIATGYHAIEFLLWGQDAGPDTAGQRPATDFVDGGTAANQDRRRLYLTTVSAMLVGHLSGLRDAWADGAQNYRSEFLAADSREALRRILTGMIILSGFETGGERLQTALDSGDQEDEHSCFSDNTHRDMVQDVRGIQNVWLGTYVRTDGTTVSGTGIVDVVAEVNSTLANQVTTQIDTSLSAAEALIPPFDQEIAASNAEGRARVQALIDSLRAQERLLEDVFQSFGLEIPVAE
ncbi:MAG: imelysin family protein [Myxococcota bacterium]|nr:imelysin family protein [Myxococcota bacterium]